MYNNLLGAALDYAARGVPTFPTDEHKRPLVASGFKAATIDPAALRRMFAIPGATMIGVPTGTASGVNALDVDPRHGGHQWLAANIQRLPETRTHRTRSDGRHLLFKADPRVRCSAGRIAPGVDVRAHGGYAIVPPSPGYRVINAAPVAPWPEWLLVPGLALAPLPIDQPATAVPGGPIGPVRISRYVESLLSRLAAAPDGQKHSALWRCGRAVGGILHLADMTEAEAEALLVGSLPATVRDWTAARKTARDAIRAGIAAPIALPDREARHG